MNNTPTIQEVKEKFLAGEIDGFISDQNKYKLFMSEFRNLCYYKNSSLNRGFILKESDLTTFEKYTLETQEDKDREQFKLIEKYRKLALENQYTNEWIEKCVALPETFEEWLSAGKKSLKDYDVVVSKVEGKVIKIPTLRKHFSKEVKSFYKHYENDEKYKSEKFHYNGYDVTLSIVVKGEEVFGHLRLEYRTRECGFNYRMINNDTFIEV